ncbi:MAG: agglutinin biogenesis protein MshI [Undibacterium sp.]|nr:agglutinin biogenesis protein MshI [Undibacterium sp.]
MAISLCPDGIYSARLTRVHVSVPTLEFVSFYPKATKSWPEMLERFAKESPAKNYRCGLLLSPDEYQLFSVEPLNVPAEELKSAMRWRLKEMLDYHIDDATFDVFGVPGDKNAGGRIHSMYAVAARNKLIAERQALFSDAKLPLSIIDIPDLAQRNISSLLEPEGRGIALLSFDENGGLLTLTFGGELYLSRRLDIKLSQLQTSDADKQTMIFERITLELQRSLDNFDRQHNFITTAKLILAPLGSVAAELQAYLASNMYMPVEVLNLENILDLSKIPELKDVTRQQAYFLTIGAALRHEETAL